METTIMPFAALPSCATTCGPLYDANGGCVPNAVPTAAPSVYASCFCAHRTLTPFNAGIGGVCDGQCDPAGLSSIRGWYTALCANVATITALPAGTVPNLPGAGSTPGGGSQPGGSQPGGSNGSSGQSPDNSSWITKHWQWVVFLVIMVFAIVGIWVGACIWRRRYLRKRDRQYALGKRMGNIPNTGSTPDVGPNASTRSVHIPAAGMFVPAPISSAGVYGPETNREKKSRNKWNPTART